MLIVTNKQAIDEAFEAARPRPIREVMLEIYPDATEDANGRFHAPYDGYECPMTGGVFRAGEFLPMEELEDDPRRFGSKPRVPTAVDLEGNLHRWEGSRGQQRAVWPLLIEQTRTHEASISRHVGEVGKMANLHDLTIGFVTSFEGFYGTTWVHIMKDPDGNVVVYKGSKRLRSGPNPYLDRDLIAGDKVSLRCKVKDHNEREGVQQTIVQRPKLLDRVKPRR